MVLSIAVVLVILVAIWWFNPAGWRDLWLVLVLSHVGVAAVVWYGVHRATQTLARQRLLVDLDAQTLTFEGFAFHRDGRAHRPGTVVVPMTEVTAAALETPIFGGGDRLTITVPSGNVSVPDGFTNFQELVSVVRGLTGEPLEPDPWRRTAQWVIVGATIATALAALVKLIW